MNSIRRDLKTYREKLANVTRVDIPLLPKLEWVVAILASLSIVLFHVIVMRHGGGLWRDEVNSLSLAKMPLSEMWDHMRYDAIPIFSVLVTRVWTLTDWGATDVGLRFYGLAVGCSILAALWFNARSIGFGIPWF